MTNVQFAAIITMFINFIAIIACTFVVVTSPFGAPVQILMSGLGLANAYCIAHTIRCLK